MENNIDLNLMNVNVVRNYKSYHHIDQYLVKRTYNVFLMVTYHLIVLYYQEYLNMNERNNDHLYEMMMGVKFSLTFLSDGKYDPNEKVIVEIFSMVYFYSKLMVNLLRMYIEEKEKKRRMKMIRFV